MDRERHGLVILGRDGVINELVDGGLKSPDDWQGIPESASAIGRLTEAGYRVVIATNQQVVSRGELSVETLHDIHERMLSEIREAGGAVDAVVFASGGRKDGQGERQPKVGLINDLMTRFGVEARHTIVIGDSREDIEAAASTGARAILLQTGAGRATLQALTRFDGVTVHLDLAAAADALADSGSG